MNKIITLTVNPAVDKSTNVAGIKPDSKLRCEVPVYEAGGGGINVSRVLNELGEQSLCMFLAGGPTGTHLENLLTELGIQQEIVPIQGWVRENLAVTDTVNKQQYRFGMPGPVVAESEWQDTLHKLEASLLTGDLLVASGSLAPGVPVDFYAKVAAVPKKKEVKFILDTSGEALQHGAQAGVYLLKPNLGEFATLCNLESISSQDLPKVARAFLSKNPCKVMVVSLGAKGALLLQKNVDDVTYIAAPVVHQKSTIGASMLAGMTFALAQRKSLTEMVKYGVASGTAATMTEGTQLCARKHVDALYQWLISDSSNMK